MTVIPLLPTDPLTGRGPGPRAGSRSGSRLEEASSAIADDLGCDVVIFDDELDVIHPASWRSEIATADLTRAIASIDWPADGGVEHVRARVCGIEIEIAVVRMDLIDQRVAIVVLLERRAGALDHGAALLEPAIARLALEVMRDQATTESQARLADGLFQLLISDRPGSESAVDRLATELGLDLTGHNTIIGAATSDTLRAYEQLAPSYLRRRMRRAARELEDVAAVFEHGAAMFLLLTCTADDTAGALQQRARTTARALSSSVPFGKSRIAFAGPHTGIDGLRRAAAECQDALHVLRVTGRAGSPTGFDDLGIWALLASADQSQLIRFRDAVLGRLFEHDARRQSQLIDTLRALVGTNFQWRPASLPLDVHPNTVRYRISVIAKLTGLDLNTYADQVKADIALRIADMLAPATGQRQTGGYTDLAETPNGNRARRTARA